MIKTKNGFIPETEAIKGDIPGIHFVILFPFDATGEFDL
jgi:hypothetical protein